MKHAAGPFDDFVISLADEAQRVAPGEYHARVTACRRSKRFGRDMLIFTFQLAPQGRFSGASVPGFCNLPEVGQHEIPARSKLAKWLRVINRFDPSSSTRSIHIRVFAIYRFLVLVELTEHDWNRIPLAPNLRYPKVQDIVRVDGKCENAKKREEKKTLLFSSLLFPPLQSVTD